MTGPRPMPRWSVRGWPVFTALAEAKTPAEGPRILLTTINSWMQRTPPKSYFRDASLSLWVGDQTSPARIAEFLEANGFCVPARCGNMANMPFRGGIMDIFAEAGQLLPDWIFR